MRVRSGSVSSTAAPTRARRVRRRWFVLAAVSAAQAVLACLFVALPVLAPTLELRFDLGIRGVGLLLASVNLGMTVTLVPWGHLADRLGERVVLTAGLVATAVALLAAAAAPSLPLMLAALTAVGFFGASVNAATTRAVISWFDAGQRGLALAIRQTSIPLGGAAFAVLLPHIAGADIRVPFLTLAGMAFAAAACVGVLVRRNIAAPTADAHAAAVRPLRSGRVWRICGSAAATLTAQSTLVGFAVLFLHERRGFSTAGAAAVLAACQVAGAAALLAAGRASDVRELRVRPLRRLAYGGGVLLIGLAVVADAPAWLTLPTLVAAAGVSFGWVALSSAVAGESVPPAQAGAASGLQQAAMAVSATLSPVLVSLVISAAGWQASFVVAALGPIVGGMLLSGLPERRPASRRAGAETLDPQLEG